MTPLAAQKRLLIAESELNRARLASDLASLSSGVANIVAGASHVETVFSSLVGLFGLWRSRPSPAGKPAAFGTVINVVTSLWQLFQRRS